ncbi:polysaccharide pyruvyl transferase family protein [Sphingobacterium sp. UBA5670]|uniref:polysaccharide pyruvyl transferase family protein n=1 Tax=Sphingobacterium sp. UBA5670 TaxID=1947502 RepID=UPI0025E689FB|nr:polysaccharide pyruvyl transferase family protein [Sphingobacterium sp. UBA5670]
MKILLKLYPKINLGDDLFLKIICERYPQHDFYLLAEDNYNIFCTYFPNLHLISPKFQDSLFNKILRKLGLKVFPKLFKKELQAVYKKQYKNFDIGYDAFVSIGGSIFMQSTENLDLDNEIAFYDLVNQALPKIPKYFVGCNFGPFKNPEYISLYKSIFQKATDVCFREEYSAEIFNDIKSVRWAPDVVFGMSIPNIEKDINSVGFSIVKARSSIDENGYYKKYSELINRYLELGKNVYLFSFCEEEGDEFAINTIISYLQTDQKVNKVFYKGNIDEFLSIYGKMNIVYCGRFHAMILSMLYQQQIYPVVYSKKMMNVLNDVQYKGKEIQLVEFLEIDIDQTIRDANHNFYDISKERVVAQTQFEALDNLLNQ